MAYSRGGLKEIIGEHSQVLEAVDKWAVVSVAGDNRAIVFKGMIRRGVLGPIGRMTDYLLPGFNVVINARHVKQHDAEAYRQQCSWVVTKINCEALVVRVQDVYLDPAHLFDFIGRRGHCGHVKNWFGEWTGEAVQLLQSCLKAWPGISLAGLMDYLREAQHVGVAVRVGLSSVGELRNFVKGQPRFFYLSSRDFVYLNGGLEADCVKKEIKRRLPRLEVGFFGDDALIIRKPWHVAAVIKPIIRDTESRIVAFDTERASDDDGEYLSTVQIAILDEEDCRAFIFDVIDWSPKNFKTSKLKHLLESERVLKVVHDCRGDSAVLEKYNIELQNVFDTAVAYSTIMEQSNVGHTPPTNITCLCELFGRFTPQRNTKAVYQGNPNFWAKRPLTQSMIDHAASDVMGLATDVYDNVRSFMNPAWKSRFDALCAKSLGH